MNLETSNIKKITTGYNPGICKMYFIPQGVLPTIQTNAAGVFTWPELLTLESFPTYKIIELDVVTDAKNVSETPKESKSGPYYELKANCSTNIVDEAIIQTLTTISLKGWQMLVRYSNGRTRIFGQSNRGLDIMHAITDSNNDKLKEIKIAITATSKRPSPFTTEIS